MNQRTKKIKNMVRVRLSRVCKIIMQNDKRDTYGSYGLLYKRIIVLSVDDFCDPFLF